MVGLNKIIATLVLATIVLAFVAPALAQGMPRASPTMMPTRMPVQMTTSNKDMMATMQGMSDLSKTTSVMKAVGMDSLMMPGKQYTMFVPNDMAVQKIGTDKINMMMKDKQMAMNLLKGHMIEGMMMPSDMTDGKTLTMMNGQSMMVKMTNGKMMIDGAAVTKAIKTTNGMIYVIDNIPSSMMSMMQMGAGQMGTAPMSR